MAALYPGIMSAFMLRRKSNVICFCPFQQEVEAFPESLATFYSPLTDHVSIIWPPLAARETGEVKFKYFVGWLVGLFFIKAI